MATERICSIKNCGKKHFARGWCRIHYYRWTRQGDPTVCLRDHGSAPRFIYEVAVPYVGDDCLTWPFARNPRGYAIINRRLNGTSSVCRLVCTAAHGPPPERRYEAAHRCGRGHEGCVNPHHLRWATPVENAADKQLHGTVLRGECHGAAKLTAEQVIAARILIGKMSNSAIGRIFGVTESTIRHIARNNNWRSLD